MSIRDGRWRAPQSGARSGIGGGGAPEAKSKGAGACKRLALAENVRIVVYVGRSTHTK